MRIFTTLIYTILYSFCLLQAQNIIVNGEFSDSTTGWETEQYNGGEFTWQIADSVGQIIIDALGTNFYDIQLKQIITLETGWFYDISFDIYASDSADIEVWIQENHEDWATFSSVTVTAHNQWQNVSYTTDEIEVDDDNAKLTFVFGNADLGDTILIDNVTMSYSDGPSAIDDKPFERPTKFSLAQNYPNPFNPQTKIKYTLQNQGKTRLTVYNSLGIRISELVNEYKSAGSYEVNFDASQLASGIYFYRLESGDFTQTKKMVLLR
jgi:hypothetical protein